MCDFRKRSNGSHHVFIHERIPGLLNLQNVKGKAKLYQIKQLLQLYVADIPDLKACSAFAETPDQTLAEVLIAKESWLASAKENGKPIPPPEYRPVIYQAV